MKNIILGVLIGVCASALLFSITGRTTDFKIGDLATGDSTSVYSRFFVRGDTAGSTNYTLIDSNAVTTVSLTVTGETSLGDALTDTVTLATNVVELVTGATKLGTGATDTVSFTGKVGIGTTGPSSELEINAALTPELRIWSTADSSPGSDVSIQLGSKVSSGHPSDLIV